MYVILLFFNKENLKLFKKCSLPWLYADRIFISAPPLFNVFFIIEGKLNYGSTFPLVYIYTI